MSEAIDLNLEVQATHDLLAEALRKRIMLGGLPSGGRLPTERELALGLGVSRNTVRKAVRTLADEGLIWTERGRNGGSFVKLSPESALRRHGIATSWRQSIEDCYSFRLALEPLAARWAAGRASAAERTTLMKLVAEQPRDLAAYHQIDSGFHLLIARMARFELLEQTIGQARQGMFRELNTLWMSFGARTDGDDLEQFEGFGREHLPIAQAISERRPADAEAAMSTHLRHARRQFAQVLEEAVGGPVEGRKHSHD
ncbi:FadR/GntR family transcriptional regulator [Leekyejoonella antrihumi]|uniref:FadR family transcriptional regulator n=1 Tax=Leekyejoonella antrihumi TaxID=1660198 RepID=A0A563E0T7_9MICO|nr:FCD domain-containing protein [Leekyejoonella antrihumi]TWP35782.1 FadR family transcriptional regulator [Leekyejoonella antrihumi]